MKMRIEKVNKMRKTIIILTLMITSLVINQNSVTAEVQPESIPVNFKFVHASRSDLGDYVAVEFNDTLMPDNQVYGPEDTVWFGFTFDVAEFRLDPNEITDRSQANYWYFAEQESGVYNETRFQGILNVYLDGTNFGLSNIQIGYYNQINTTQDLWQNYLTPGWHILTVFAAEYVSNAQRTEMFWQTAKDEKWFYVTLDQEDTDMTPPARETSEEMISVKANPLRSDEWYPTFDWDFVNIYPRARNNAETPISQVITQAGQEVQLQADFNVTTGSLMLTDTNSTGTPETVYYDPAHMGVGITFWWINDGPVTDDLQTTFEINKGDNFIYFTAIGFRAYEFAMLVYGIYIPRADIDSNVFIVTENIPTNTAFGFGSFVLTLGIFAIISIYLKKKRD